MNIKLKCTKEELEEFLKYYFKAEKVVVTLRKKKKLNPIALFFGRLEAEAKKEK